MMRRKQYDELKKLELPSGSWCHILGVIMHDPDGWREPREKSFDEPISLPEFVRRAFSSTIGSEDGSSDLFDCENYAAEDGEL